MTVQEALNILWGAYVEGYQFDLIHRAITFSGYRIYGDDKQESFVLTFHDVASFYFVQESGSGRFQQLAMEEWERIEITSALYEPLGVGHCHLKAGWGNVDFPSTPNFELELWSARLFIEAEQVTLNDTKFFVGFASSE